MKMEKSYIAVCVLSVISVLLAATSISMSIKNGKLQSENSTLTEKSEAIYVENKRLAEEEATTKHRLAECQKKIADPSKRNVADMQSYVMARYSKVPRELAALISQKTDEIADRHDVDFALVVGVMDVESAFNPFAISKADARGLMQVRWKVWGKKYSIEKASDLHDIALNIETGIKVLKYYIDKNKGSISRALKDYNGGGKTYAESVYVAVGRFTTFRNNSYQDEEEDEEDDAKRIPVRDPNISESVPQPAGG
jgi:soluble lytic murein transglycosylase-like protein